MDQAKKYNMTFENLAIPEVNTGDGTEQKTADSDPAAEDAGDAITYDTVAIPEVHIKKLKEAAASGKKEEQHSESHR